MRTIYWIAKLNPVNIILGLTYIILSLKKPSQDGEGEITSGYILKATKKNLKEKVSQNKDKVREEGLCAE